MFVFLAEIVYMRAQPPYPPVEETLRAPAVFIHSRFDSSNVRRFLRRASKYGAAMSMYGISAWLTSCASGPPAPVPPGMTPLPASASIEKSIPRTVPDRAGWAVDIHAAFAVLGIDPTRENICAVAAVIEQESGFRVDPVIPGLPAIAWREIDGRAEHAGVPRIVLHTALQLTSPTGRSYGDRIDAARTEKDLSDIFEDFIGAMPLGKTLFAERNPIRTRGPMQVNIAFAEQFASVRPYPYPVKSSIADELFTRRGSLYFGAAHLLAYQPSYDAYLYRFADFNAGQYASRNAAFQSAVSSASGIPLAPDGALLPHDGKGIGSTELAVRTLGKKLTLGDNAIHSALEQGKGADFERTLLYERLYAIAEKAVGHRLPRAAVPRIQLHGPKIARHLTTDWYARRVDHRFKHCLAQ
jgi:hypothetical protein